MTQCEMCFEEIVYPFTCNFCGGKFCPKHRLPENHLCLRTPQRTPLGSWKAKKTSNKNNLPFPHVKRSRMFKPKSIKNFVLSLKLWFPIFLGTIALLFLLEKDNPAQFYLGVDTYIKYGLYVVASLVGLGTGYRIFKKCDYNPSSDRGIFALRLLSGGVLILAIFFLYIGIALMFDSFFFFGSWFIESQLSLTREISAFFFIVLSLVLIVTSAYLLFKFQRRSGVIIYRR